MKCGEVQIRFYGMVYLSKEPFGYEKELASQELEIYKFKKGIEKLPREAQMRMHDGLRIKVEQHEKAVMLPFTKIDLKKEKSI